MIKDTSTKGFQTDSKESNLSSNLTPNKNQIPNQFWRNDLAISNSPNFNLYDINQRNFESNRNFYQEENLLSNFNQ